MDTVIIDDRDLPEDRPAEVVDGCDYRDALHLQVLTESGPPAVDLVCTSATWTLVVSDEQGGTALLTKTSTAAWTTSGVYVEDAPTGYVHVVVCAADVATLGPGDYYYEATVTLPAGHAYLPSRKLCLVCGTLTVNAAAAA